MVTSTWPQFHDKEYNGHNDIGLRIVMMMWYSAKGRILMMSLPWWRVMVLRWFPGAFLSFWDGGQPT